MSKKIFKAILLVALLSLLTACQNMESRKVGMRFWRLPPQLGGGVSARVFAPGELVFHYPFVSQLYVVDVGKRDFSFRFDSEQGSAGALETRALDGNEVALEVTVTYEIDTTSDKLQKLFTYVGPTQEDIERIIMSVARADIRTFMNELRTSQFIDSVSSYKALHKVQDNMKARLDPYGIIIGELKLDSFRFDEDYENLLKQIQKISEDVKRERERKLVIQKQMERDNATAVGVRNASLKDAGGYKELRIDDGKNYLEEQKNIAEGILAVAEAERDALQKQIAALSGPGGSALVKLELAKQLLKNNPQFVVMGKGSDEGQLTVNRIDTNQLMDQAKVFEALKEGSAKDPITAAKEKVLKQELPHDGDKGAKKVGPFKIPTQ